MTSPSTATAVAREAAWLAAADGLPALLSSAGGPFGIVQAYWPGARFAQQKTGLYVDAKLITVVRVSNQRIRNQYEFTLKATWPVKNPTPPIAEGAQQAFANAIELVVERINGFIGDKTHGGAFLSVAENPRLITLTKEDPETMLAQQPGMAQVLRENVVYRADDFEING